MLIILTAWFVHNWWKLLIGLVMVIVILEGSHRKKVKDAEAGGSDAGHADPTDVTGASAQEETETSAEEPEEQEVTTAQEE